MQQGLENVLRAAVKQGVSRFVHLSIVAVYGDHPGPECSTEDAPARRTDLEYGNEKLEQEQRLARCARRHGLPAVILGAPNVYGPNSPFTTGLISKLRTGRMAIVDEGHNPCNLVYVDNLVESIFLALYKPRVAGHTFFITDSEAVPWARCVMDHAALCQNRPLRVTSTELWPVPPERPFRESFRMLPRVLLSGEIRAILRQIPLVRLLESHMYSWFLSFSEDTQTRIRLLINGPVQIRTQEANGHGVDPRDGLISAQRRATRHSSKKAQRLLGYTAPVSYTAGMALTAAWLRYARIV